MDREKRNAYYRKYSKKLRDKLRTAGICLACHNRKAQKGHACCEICLIKKRGGHIFESSGLFIARRLKEQNGKCAICGKKKKLLLDHLHSSGKRRGLLCNRCNIGLGMFLDNVSSLNAATRYLKL